MVYHATEILCCVCAEEINEGNIDGKHLSERGWANVKKKFNEWSPKGYEYKQLKNKWENLKCLWNKWKNPVGPTTGVGCHFKKGIDADDDWWGSRIQGCPQAVKSHLQRIPNFEDVYNVLEDQINCWH